MRWFRHAAEPTLEAVELPEGYEVEVVGESHYQEALHAIAVASGEFSANGIHFDCTAILRPEPTNPFDSDAIRIEIGGQLVGYLNRTAAKAYKATGDFLAANRQIGSCHATIVGGWDRGENDSGSFGVRLNLSPLR
jgi:hypothetical protein